MRSAPKRHSGLGDSDRFCLYVAGEQPVPLIAEPVSDTEEGLAQLKALEMKRSSSNLASALQAAHQALQQETRGREKEIYLITDMREVDWLTDEGKPKPGLARQLMALDPQQQRLTASDEYTVTARAGVLGATIEISVDCLDVTP